MNSRSASSRFSALIARRLFIQHLESRRILALTTPDIIETFSSSDDYTAPYEVQTRIAAKTVTNIRGQSSYDLRVNLPGDQSIHFNASPIQVLPTAFEGSSVSILVDPNERYELRALNAYDSNNLPIEAYDAAGRLIESFPLWTDGDFARTKNGGIHLAYLGVTEKTGIPSRLLPPNTSEIVFTRGYSVSFGFVGDRLESGSQPVAWNDEPAIISNSKVDFVEADHPIFVSASRPFVFSAQVSNAAVSIASHALGYTAFDRDGLTIEPIHVERYVTATDTYLATELKPGDTFINLQDATGWSNLSSDTQTRSLAWYGYRDGAGQLVADFTYTRNTASDPINGLWAAGGVVGNRIALNSPWSGPAIATGTAVRNAVAGKALYALANFSGPNSMESRVAGFWQRGIRDIDAFPPATAFFRPAAILNQAVEFTPPTRLQYQVRSGEPIARMPGGSTVRTIDIDVLANDSPDSGIIIESITQPEFGTAVVLRGANGGRDRIQFIAPAYFSGSVQLRYVVRSQATNEVATETVTIRSLFNNLDADPMLKQSVSVHGDSLRPVVDSFIVTKNERLQSGPNNLNRLLGDERGLNNGTYVQLTRAPNNGSLSLLPNGEFKYQPNQDFVGLDSFEYLLSDATQRLPSTAHIRVVANHAEHDLLRIADIGLGQLSFESNFRRLFYSTHNSSTHFDANGAPYLSWRVHMLPFLGYQELYQQFKLDEPWNSPRNLTLLNKMPDIFRSGDDPLETTTTRFQTIQALDDPSPTEHFLKSNNAPKNNTFSSLAARSPSNLLLIVQSGADRAVPWTKPQDLAFNAANPVGTLGTLQAGLTAAVFADGRARWLRSDISASEFTSIATVKVTPGNDAIDVATLARKWGQESNWQLSAQVPIAENFRILAQGFHNYADAVGRLPPSSSIDTSGNPLLSWRVLILPYIGATELYNRFRLTEAWDSPHNIQLLKEMPDVFRSLEAQWNDTNTRVRLLDGTGTAYDRNRRGTLRFSSFTDGTHQSILFVEAGTDKAIPWTMPEALPVDMTSIWASLGNLPLPTMTVATADGGVIALPRSSTNAQLAAFATIDSQRSFVPIPPEEFNTHLILSDFPTHGGEIENALRQIALGMHNYESSYKKLPGDCWGQNNCSGTLKSAPTLSWRVAILPFIEHENLYRQFNLNEPWDSPHNLALLPFMPNIFRGVGDPVGSVNSRILSFAGSEALMNTQGKTIRFSNLNDGTSNTLAFAFVGRDKGVPWTKPGDIDAEAADIWRAIGAGKSTFFALADGSVRQIAKKDATYLNGMAFLSDGGVHSSGPSKNLNAPIVNKDRIILREGDLERLDVIVPIANMRLEFDGGNAVTMSEATESSSEVYASGSAASYIFRAANDAMLNGPRHFQLRMLKPSIPNDPNSPYILAKAIDVVVLDDEGLSVTTSATSVEGDANPVKVRISRGSLDVSSPLEVFLAIDRNDWVNLPRSIVIPAGHSFVELTLELIRCTNGSQPETLRITASALGLVDAEAKLLVKPVNDTVLTFDNSTMSERGGIITATLSRQSCLAQSHTFRLATSNVTHAVAQPTVTMASGQSSISFEIRAIDNALLEGTTTIEVTATGITDVISGTIAITDHETLSLSINTSSIQEKNGAAIGTVSRSDVDSAQPLLVMLENDNPAQLSIPPHVIIPSGQSQTTFAISSVNDNLVDGAHSVLVTASAANYDGTASAFITVFDDDRKFPWQNSGNRHDVNDDGVVTPLDAILVISALTSRQQLTSPPPDPFLPTRYVDVNGDGVLSPLDVLLVISALSRSRSSTAEGESHSSPDVVDEKSAYMSRIDLAIDQIAGELELWRKRRPRA